MKTIYLLTIEDINTSRMGDHVLITFLNNDVINLTKEAAKELLNDLKIILNENTD